jgi:hypothetical protein
LASAEVAPIFVGYTSPKANHSARGLKNPKSGTALLGSAATKDFQNNCSEQSIAIEPCISKLAMMVTTRSTRPPEPNTGREEQLKDCGFMVSMKLQKRRIGKR